MATIRRYKHVNWALADQTLVSGSNFLTMILLARHLGLEEFGRFTLAWMVVLYSVNLHGTFVISPMVSIGPKQREDDRPFYFGALALQHLSFVILSFVLISIGALISDWFFPSANIGLLAIPIACASIAYNTHEFLRRYFFSIQREGRAFATDALRYPCQILAIAILTELIVVDAAISLWILSACAFAGFAPFARQLPRVGWNRAILRSTIVRHWNFSKWLAFNVLANFSSNDIFFIVAGALFGASAVGALNASRTLLNVSQIVFFGLTNVAQTQAARRFDEAGIAALTRYLGRLTVLVGGLTSCIAIAAAVAPEFWLRFAFGSEYIGFGYLVRWWAVIVLFRALGLPLRIGLIAIERTKPFFTALVLTTGFSVVFAYAIVTHLELVGVVTGILIASLIRNGVLAHSLYRELGDLRIAR